MIVWLKYIEGGAPHTRRYNALTTYERDQVDYAQNRTLGGVDVQHRVTLRSTYELGIGPDELMVPSAYAYLRAWASAEIQFLAVVSSLEAPEPDEEDFIAVTAPNGSTGFDFLNGNRLLPNYNGQFTEKRPRIT